MADAAEEEGDAASDHSVVSSDPPGLNYDSGSEDDHDAQLLELLEEAARPYLRQGEGYESDASEEVTPMSGVTEYQETDHEQGGEASSTSESSTSNDKGAEQVFYVHEETERHKHIQKGLKKKLLHSLDEVAETFHNETLNKQVPKKNLGKSELETGVPMND